MGIYPCECSDTNLNRRELMNKMPKKQGLTLILTTIMLLIVAGGCSTTKAGEVIDSYEECVKAGNPILKTLPPKCMANGKVFTKGRNNKSQRMRMCRDMCGNGTCDMIVCQSQGCPCPEDNRSCPLDCK